MTAKVFGAALGIATLWSVGAVNFNEISNVLTVQIDFKPGTRFAISGHKGVHQGHDTAPKTYRHVRAEVEVSHRGCG